MLNNVLKPEECDATEVEKYSCCVLQYNPGKNTM